MPLQNVLGCREYDKFTTDSNNDTAVRIVGEVQIVGAIGTKFRSVFEGVTVPATETTAITFTVGAGLSRQLSQLHVSCYRNCKIRVKNGVNLLASGRTASGAPNLTLNFQPTESILTGETVTVTFEGLSGENASDIEIFLTGIES